MNKPQVQHQKFFLLLDSPELDASDGRLVSHPSGGKVSSPSRPPLASLSLIATHTTGNPCNSHLVSYLSSCNAVTRDGGC